MGGMSYQIPLPPGFSNYNAVRFRRGNKGHKDYKRHGEDSKPGMGLGASTSGLRDEAVAGISIWGEILFRGRGLNREKSRGV